MLTLISNGMNIILMAQIKSQTSPYMLELKDYFFAIHYVLANKITARVSLIVVFMCLRTSSHKLIVARLSFVYKYVSSRTCLAIDRYFSVLQDAC